MKTLLVAALVAVSTPAGAASHWGARFGGRRACGGFQMTYSRQTSHSAFSLRFSGGLWSGCRGSRIVFPGAIGSACWSVSSAGGVWVFRGWAPRSPYFARWYPPHVGFGPFEYVDAIVVTGPPAGVVFGHRREPSRPAGSARETPRRGVRALDGLAAPRLVDLGDEEFARGEFRRAVEFYRAAAKKAPKDPAAAFALGHGLFAIGSYEEAARELRRAIRLFPDIVTVPMNRRDFYGDGRVFDEQLARLADHVKRNPRDRQARFLLAYNYYFSGRQAASREHFAALGPRDPEALVFLRNSRPRAR